jgi:hypothetical protein
MLNRMEIDLANQLTDRIRTAVRDTLDTARRGNMPEQDAILMVLTVLMSEAATGLLAYGASEKAVTDMAAMSYRGIAKQLKALEARQAKARH